MEVALFALDVLAQEADQVAAQGQELAELAGGVEVEELAAELVESLPEDVVLVAQLAHQAAQARQLVFDGGVEHGLLFADVVPELVLEDLAELAQDADGVLALGVAGAAGLVQRRLPLPQALAQAGVLLEQVLQDFSAVHRSA